MSRLFLTSDPIKNIVFDFGGVLLDLDFDRTYEEMSKLLGIPFYPDNFSESTLAILHDFERGKISKEGFIWHIQQLSRKSVPQGKEIIDAWNAMLLGWKPEKLDYLQDLRRRYKVFMLSNTNIIHIEWVHQDLQKNHGIYYFENVFFNKAYYSHEVQMRKPDSEIFHFITKDADIQPEESLYIDDLIENVNSAREIGFQGYWHNPSDDLVSNLKDMII
jgi:putative hydrolase of the HAD superfamily